MNGRVAITGGHATPALALIEKIEADKESSWKIFYYGNKYALEGSKRESFEYRELATHQNVSFIYLNTGRIQRRFQFQTIPSFFKIPLGFFKALFSLYKIKPNLIISFGGYLSTPVIFAGWLLGIPSITHEQTRSLGLANKINSLFSKQVAVSFPEVISQVPPRKAVLVGNLVNDKLFTFSPQKESQLHAFVTGSDKPILFITGGKSGSKIINSMVKSIRKKLTKKFSVVHQFGADDQVFPKKDNNYLAIPFLEANDFDWVLRRSSVVISRSGANVTLRLAVLKKKAVLIPIPWTSGDEQSKNAQFLKEIGLGFILPQDELSPKKLLRVIEVAEIAKVKPHYPLWWPKVDPTKAAGKLWQLAKSTLK